MESEEPKLVYRLTMIMEPGIAYPEGGTVIFHGRSKQVQILLNAETLHDDVRSHEMLKNSLSAFRRGFPASK
jgi:hypothetical protein